MPEYARCGPTGDLSGRLAGERGPYDIGDIPIRGRCRPSRPTILRGVLKLAPRANPRGPDRRVVVRSPTRRTIERP